jgi:tetratricopeptide (TPR) repeat protein
MAKPRPSSSADTAQIAKLLQEAVALHQRGAFDDAERRYARVLELAPTNFNALHLLGLLRHQQGRPAEALQTLAMALRSPSVSAEALSNYGVVLDSVGRHDEAVASFDKALALKPGQAQWHYKRGRALVALDRHDDAIAAFDQAVALQPDHAEALADRGAALLGARRFDAALESFDRVLALKPDHLDALNNRAVALYSVQRYAEALASLDAALAIQPRLASAMNNRGNVLLAQHRAAEALACYEAALAIDPSYADAVLNCGHALASLERIEEAEQYYDRAIALQPDASEPKMTKGLFYLARGRFAEGWPLYDARWSGFVSGVKNRRYALPRWNGEPVRRLVLWGEQGLGDEILYAGLLADLRAKAESIVLEVQPRLLTLFARSFPGIEVVAQGRTLHAGEGDAHCPLSGLGRFLRPDWGSFRRPDQGYLVADAARATTLRKRLAADGQQVIGLSWRSTAKTLGKSAALCDFESILRMPGCRCIDLQYGDTRTDHDALERELGLRLERLDDVDNTNDIDGLAALMTACDVVVTVSNTNAHLAAALGRLTFVFVPRGNASIWYWFKDRQTSPWHAHAQMRHQASAQPWADLIARSTDEIAALLARPNRDTV